MALFQINNIEMAGLSACIPKTEIDNKSFPYHSATENAQFIKTTGIEFRRVVDANTTASDLCFKAAEKLLEELTWRKEEIQILIFVSQTPDYKIPCTATILQDKLGLPKSCVAFDINLGCSGYVYGLSVVAALLERIKGKALLLVGDTSSTCISDKDRTTAPLFSDAGSATALSYDDNAEPMYFNLQSDGAGYNAIITKDGGSRYPINEDSFIKDEQTGRSNTDMFLDGIKVFNFSRREVVPNVNELIKTFGIEKSEIDFFVFHQANKLMNETIAKKLELSLDKVPLSLKNLGNSGAASIPVTIVDQLLAATNKGEKRLLLSGFGVGLSWASCVVNWAGAPILAMIEYEHNN